MAGESAEGKRRRASGRSTHIVGRLRGAGVGHHAASRARPVGDAGAGVESERARRHRLPRQRPKRDRRPARQFFARRSGRVRPGRPARTPAEAGIGAGRGAGGASPGRVRQHLFRDRGRSRRRVVATVRTGRAPVGRVRLGAGPGGTDLARTTALRRSSTPTSALWSSGPYTCKRCSSARA